MISFRLRLKNAYERLNVVDREEFFDHMRALNNIDPFRYSWVVFLLMFAGLFLGFYRVSVWVGIFYLAWSILYFLAFLGVYFMWKRKVGK